MNITDTRDSQLIKGESQFMVHFSMYPYVCDWLVPLLLGLCLSSISWHKNSCLESKREENDEVKVLLFLGQAHHP